MMEQLFRASLTRQCITLSGIAPCCQFVIILQAPRIEIDITEDKGSVVFLLLLSS